MALADRNQGQQTPQTVPVFQSELDIKVAREETTENRLQNIFGVHLGADVVIEPAARQGDEPMAIAVENMSCSILVPGFEAVHPFIEGQVLSHCGFLPCPAR